MNTHSRLDGNNQRLASRELSLELLTELTFGELQIVLNTTVGVQEGDESGIVISNIDQLTKRKVVSDKFIINNAYLICKAYYKYNFAISCDWGKDKTNKI